MSEAMPAPPELPAGRSAPAPPDLPAGRSSGLWRILPGWLRLSVGALGLLGILTAVATVLWHGPLPRMLATVQDDICTAGVQWICPRQGRVALGSPEIYTRERLVDDRLEHINWLNQQLRGMEEVGREPFRALGVTTTRDQRIMATVTPPGGAVSNAGAPEAGGAGPQEPRRPPDDVAVATVSRYRQMGYFRELLRAERTRATLDDRHDIEGNTILQVVFDTTVVPAANRRGFALVAVRVGQPPAPLAGDTGVYLAGDWDRLYADWLLTLERDIDNTVQQRQFGLLSLRDFREQGQELLSLRPLLAAWVCEEAMRLRSLPNEPNEIDLRARCFDQFSGASRASAPNDREQSWRASFAENLHRVIDDEKRRFDGASLRQAEKLRESLTARLELLVPAILPPPPGESETQDAARDRRDRAVAVLQRRMPTARILWQYQCRLPGGDGRVPRSETLRARDLLMPDELDRIAPQLRDLELRLPCAVLFRPLEEALLLHALAEHLQRLRTTGRPAQDDPIYSALTADRTAAQGQPAAANNLCIGYDHDFLPDDADRTWLSPDRTTCVRDQLEVRVTLAAVSCAAAELRRMQLSRPGMGSGAAERRGADDHPLSHYVRLVVLPGAQGYCRLQPQRRDQGPTLLREALLKLPHEVYAYGLSPRNATQRIESRIEDSIALSVLGAGSSRAASSGTREAIATLAQRFVGAQDTPFVVGFGGEAAVHQGGDRSGQHAGFGWIIAPRRSGIDTDTHTLEMHTLSAVLSVPSWWRRIELAIQECWVPVTGLPEAAEVLRSFASKEREALTPDERTRLGCREPRQLNPRIPGGEADITRALRIEVIRTPYLQVRPTDAETALANVGQRASFRITGGRLWRSTAVTLAGQPADRIRILPNMMGIVAEFDCVQPPNQVVDQRQAGNSGPPPDVVRNQTSGGPPPPGTGPPHLGSASSGSPPRTVSARLQVWTSEGNTDDQRSVQITADVGAQCGTDGRPLGRAAAAGTAQPPASPPPGSAPVR